MGPRIYKLGLRIPFNFGYYININEKWGLNVFTGPQLNYAFFGRAEYDEGVEYDGVITPHIFKGENGQNRFELGWKIGVGFPVEHFLISLEADLGITNLMKNKTTFRENRVGLGISYYF